MASGGERGGDLRLEEVVPSFAWTEDSDCHCLLIDLPGFKKDEVKLEVDDYDHVIATGERKVSENKRIRFRQSYKVPQNSKIEETSAKFDDEILYIIIPKQTKTNNEENQIGNSSNNNEQQNEPKQAENGNNIVDNEKNDCCNKRNDEEKFHDAATATQWYANGVLEIMKERLKKKKRIIVTAVLAFSLGVIVAHKFQSRGD